MENFKIISKDEYEKDNKKPNQNEIWDSLAKPWETYVVKKIPIVQEFLKNKRGKIIDLGCGTGRNMIVNNEIEYYGVDFSELQLVQAKNYINKNEINGRVFNLKASNLSIFEDNYFDYGLFIACLHCIENKEERLKSLEEFYRVLKKNGEGLISVWNSEDKRFDSVENKGEVYMSWYKDKIPYMRYYYLFGKDEILELIRSVGFEIIEVIDVEVKDRFSKKNWVIKVKK